MQRIYYAERDTTLYEKHPGQNTGIDEILELTKIASGSRLLGAIQAKTFNTRFLVDFGTEITNIGRSISNGEIPTLSNQHPTSASVFLNLRATEASDLLISYDVEAFPVFESWKNRNGRFDNIPKTKVECSWFNRFGDEVAQTGTVWDVGGAPSSGSSKTTSEIGGGAWYTGSGFEASQSFNNESPDIRMDVTDIVKKWVDGAIVNNGFIIKRPHADEIDGEIRGAIKYFSRESHTVFVPRLEVCWDDSERTITSGTQIISSNTYVPYFKNIKAEYRSNEIAKFHIGVRPEFPEKTFATGSFFITRNVLPVSSSYEIIDTITNDVIIKDDSLGSGKVFSDSKTKISNNGNGSFFSLRMDSFMPERFYKIKLTCRRTDDTQTFDDFHFKVVR